MKSYIYKFFALVLLVSITSACGDFGDMNVDPNEPTDVPAENLVTQAMFGSTYFYWERTANAEMGMLFVQHLAQSEYTEEQRYNFNNSNFNVFWSVIYAGGYVGNFTGIGPLADYKEAKRLIMENVELNETIKANQIAVIDIMEAFTYQMATDIWGDIPYSEALSPDEFVQPKYDTQASIYAALVAKLKSAVASINASANGFSSGADILYGGNMAAWERFGNALLLRIGMRVSDVDASLAQDAVSAALGGNIISSVDEEAKLIFDSGERTANPFWYDTNAVDGTGARDDFRITEELLSVLENMGDPRIEMYADTASNGEYVGMPYGLQDGPATELKKSTSRYHASIREATAPANLIRYSEVKLLEAEAIARGLAGGVASDAYDAGVTAAMNEWGITDTDAINAYLAANPYDAANWKESIAMQMWIGLYTNGLEAWASWRRYDYPNLTPAQDQPFRSYIPVRGLYPNIEQATNSSNLAAAIASIGANEMNVKLWWDVN